MIAGFDIYVIYTVKVNNIFSLPSECPYLAKTMLMHVLCPLCNGDLMGGDDEITNRKSVCL